MNYEPKFRKRIYSQIKQDCPGATVLSLTPTTVPYPKMYGVAGILSAWQLRLLLSEEREFFCQGILDIFSLTSINTKSREATFLADESNLELYLDVLG